MSKIPDTGAAALRYLDDLKPGDRFVSGEHALDEALQQSVYNLGVPRRPA